MAAGLAQQQAEAAFFWASPQGGECWGRDASALGSHCGSDALALAAMRHPFQQFACFKQPLCLKAFGMCGLDAVCGSGPQEGYSCEGWPWHLSALIYKDQNKSLHQC